MLPNEHPETISTEGWLGYVYGKLHSQQVLAHLSFKLFFFDKIIVLSISQEIVVRVLAITTPVGRPYCWYKEEIGSFVRRPFVLLLYIEPGCFLIDW